MDDQKTGNEDTSFAQAEALRDSIGQEVTMPDGKTAHIIDRQTPDVVSVRHESGQIERVAAVDAATRDNFDERASLAEHERLAQGSDTPRLDALEAAELERRKSSQ